MKNIDDSEINDICNSLQQKDKIDNSEWLLVGIGNAGAHILDVIRQNCDSETNRYVKATYDSDAGCWNYREVSVALLTNRLSLEGARKVFIFTDETPRNISCAINIADAESDTERRAILVRYSCTATPVNESMKSRIRDLFDIALYETCDSQDKIGSYDEPLLQQYKMTRLSMDILTLDHNSDEYHSKKVSLINLRQEIGDDIVGLGTEDMVIPALINLNRQISETIESIRESEQIMRKELTQCSLPHVEMQFGSWRLNLKLNWECTITGCPGFQLNSLDGITSEECEQWKRKHLGEFTEMSDITIHPAIVYLHRLGFPIQDIAWLEMPKFRMNIEVANAQ